MNAHVKDKETRKKYIVSTSTEYEFLKCSCLQVVFVLLQSNKEKKNTLVLSEP